MWWLRHKPHRVPAEGAVRHVGTFAGVTLYRYGCFQVQLFIGRPNIVTPSHTHPNIDSIEVYVAGDGSFEAASGRMWHGMAEVAPNEPHSAIAGPRGHAFYSLQKWLNGVEPHSVEDDWTGNTLDQQHAEQIRKTP